MKQSINRFSKGLSNDVHPTNQPNDSYFDSIGGNLIYNDNGNYDWVVSNGNKLSFTMLPNGGAVAQASDKYIPIGISGNSNIKILFSTCIATGDSEIGIFSINDKGVGQYKTLFNDLNDPNGEKLNFLVKNQIEARFLYENDNMLRVYWVDGVESDSNRPRTFTFKYDPLIGIPSNILAYSVVSNSVHTMSSQANFNPGIIKYVQKISGGLKSGVYQYTYQLITKDGYATPWTPPTKKIFLTTDDVDNSNWNKYEMEGSGIVTAKGNRLEIKGIDTRYTDIRVAYIYSETTTTINETNIFYQNSINGNTSLTIDHLDNSGDPVLASAISTQFSGIKAAKTLDIKDSVLYYGNIIENLSFISNPELIVSGMTAVPVFKDMRSDELNYSNTTTPPLTHQTIKNTTTVRKMHNDTGGTETYQIVNDYVNYKGTQVEHLWSGYFRGETYRFGIVFFDLLGLPVFVIHLADFKFPEQSSNAYSWTRIKADGTTVSGSGTLSERAWPTNNYGSYTSTPIMAGENTGAGTYSHIRIMGIEFSGIDISSIKSQISGFKIVRTTLDKSIVAQGLILPCVVEDGNKTRPFPGTSQRWFDNGGGSLDNTTPIGDIYLLNPNVNAGPLGGDPDAFRLRPNISCFHAPDYDFDATRVPAVMTQDRLRLVGGCFTEANNTPPGAGDASDGSYFTVEVADGGIHSIQKYYYSKNLYHLTSGDPFPRYLNEATISEDIVMSIGEIKTDYQPGLDLHNALETFWSDTNPEGFAKSYVLKAHYKGNTHYYIHGNFDPSSSGGTNFGPIYAQSFLPADYHHGFFIANYVRLNANPYGGTNLTSLEQSLFFTTGHFQPVNNPSFATPSNDIFDEIEVFGGDCYLDYFGFLRAYANMWDADNPDDPTVAGSGADDNGDIALGVVFPLESSLNHSLRNAPSQDNPMYTDVGSMSRGEYTGSDNNNFEHGLHYADTSLIEEFNLNKVLLFEELTKFFFAKPVRFSDNSRYPVRWRYTQNKFYGDSIDSWRAFLANDFRDLVGSYGQITSSAYLLNQIYSWQESAFGRLRASDRALIDSSSGALTTGTGAKLDGIDYISTEFGNQHQFSLVNSGNAAYWIDVDKRKAMRFAQDGRLSLSDYKGLHTFFKKGLGAFHNKDNPAYNGGINGVYDFSNNHVYWTLMRDHFRTLNTNTRIVSAPSMSDDFYDNNETIFVHWTGISASGVGLFFPEGTDGTNENTNVVHYVMTDATSNTVWLHTVDSNNVATPLTSVTAGQCYMLTRPDASGPWIATLCTLADITPHRATVCFNEDVNEFTGYFPFKPTFYGSHKNFVISHDAFFNGIDNKYYAHDINSLKANYYGQNYKSILSISSAPDSPVAKLFDGIRMNINQEGNDTMSRYLFVTEFQKYYYDIQTDTRKKYLESVLRMPTRTFFQTDRTRGRWANFTFEFKNNSDTAVKINNLITEYRISNRL